ncbi:hypothetical protein GSI_05237 [Ganoderma sinense ZZ0214-1]|uniref:F-box domain-containing protein n=1 Tax=Ganoderma sinense ZZ0214-1 TaxID=1077348 RepID=A0A2G8SFI5_9APHY|nr:hypothetical protein GSI_05237 [Ganoderma sinense ZZ0214-1]
MSFLSRRKNNGAAASRSSLLQDSANVPRKSTAATASIYSVESKKAPSILRKKHISFPSTFNKLAAKLTSRHPPAASTHAPVGNVGSPLAYWRSRSPSPALSLDIRMPADLGRRASELGDREEYEEFEVLAHEEQRLRPRSELDRPQPELKKPVLARVSPELLSSVFSHATSSDLFSLVRVSKAWSQAALRALYDDVDLRNMDDERVEQCVASLASHRSLATLVRKFACRDLPPPDGIAVGMATSLSVVTFAIALTNMDHLHSLALPHFDLRILAHTTFSLRSLTLHSKTIYADDFHALFSWLGRHPALHTLCLPNLVLPSLPPAPSNPVDTRKIPSRPHTPHIPDTPPQAPRRPATNHDCKSKSASPSPTSETPPPVPFPATLLPQLQTLTCPPALATALVPGRPLVRVQIPIQCTLYDGLRPSALMSALAAARETLRVLAIQPTSTKIDQRTIERVVMAAGAELGECVETLEVHWVLDDEILYKLVTGFLPRFPALSTLALVRDSPPPHPPSPLLEFPLPPSSPLSTSPNSRRASCSSYASSSLYRPARNSGLGLGGGSPAAVNTLGVSASPGGRPPSARSADIPFPRVHERGHLGTWSKTCPNLRKVLFLSGAEWAVWPDPTKEGEAQFEFVSYEPQ